jgi:hypothetical protein
MRGNWKHEDLIKKHEKYSYKRSFHFLRYIIFLWADRNKIQCDSKLLSGFLWPIIWTSYVLWKASMLKLFNILQHWFYKQQIVLSCTFIFHNQFYFILSYLKVIGHENPDNNLELRYNFTTRYYYGIKRQSCACT